MKLGFIGTGNLASAILRGVVSANEIPLNEIAIYDINPDKVISLCNELSVNAAQSAQKLAEDCEYIVIAVKPKDFGALAEKISGNVKANDAVVISTAAGTQLEKIKSYFGYNVKAVRIMPNINASVGESMTALCASERVTDTQKEFAFKLCSFFGRTVELEEKYFSAFTAIAGSAPAFAYMFADALAVAGIKYGLPADTAQKIASQMLLGSAKQLIESPLSISELIRRVCSPAGTTIEGVCSLKETGFESSVITAVEKTVEKDLRLSAEQ